MVQEVRGSKGQEVINSGWKGVKKQAASVVVVVVAAAAAAA